MDYVADNRSYSLVRKEISKMQINKVIKVNIDRDLDNVPAPKEFTHERSGKMMIYGRGRNKEEIRRNLKGLE